MLDLGISKMALIGVVALIVIGPEKLPRVARTVGTLLGKAQRYVSDVKAEVNRAMDLDELKKMKESVEQAGKDVQQSFTSTKAELEKGFSDVASTINSAENEIANALKENEASISSFWQDEAPQYKPPRKNWRLKKSAVPQWYKMRHGVRGQVQSGAARVKRYRPSIK